MILTNAENHAFIVESFVVSTHDQKANLCVINDTAGHLLLALPCIFESCLQLCGIGLGETLHLQANCHHAFALQSAHNVIY